jgi:hypothetical protein
MKLRFFQYLEASALANIDQEIESEVLPYVKTFNALPDQVQAEARYVAETLNPVEYFNNLYGAWKDHNELARTIDGYLFQIYSGQLSPDSCFALKQARKLLEQAFETEHRKRVYSAGVKIALDRYIQLALERYNLSQKGFYILLTPGVMNFWTSYQGEHAEYVYAEKTSANGIGAIKDRLCKMFHAEEEIIFSSRLKKDFGEIQDYTPSQLKLIIDEFQKYKSNVRELVVKGFYLTLGRPDLEYIQKIISYDNCQEYLFGCNLYGIPDLYLRRLMIQTLVNRAVIDSRDGVFFYSKDELMKGLNHMITSLEKTVSVCQEQEKEPSVFLQTRGTTCGVACMMMAMNYFLGTPLNSVLEGKLRRKLKMKKYDLIPALNLATYAKQHGLDVAVFHQDSDKFWDFLRMHHEDIFHQQEAAYARALSHGIKPNHDKITVDAMINALNAGKLLIYGIFLDDNIKHALLIYMHKQGIFYVVDPLFGKRTFTTDELMYAGNLDTGRWYISVGIKQNNSHERSNYNEHS